MSAWLVSNYHVNALAAFAQDQGVIDDPASLALMLWTENRASLRARYAERADGYWPDLPHLERVFRFEDATLPSVWGVLKAVHCYVYQSCEHDGWADSAARRVCDRIEARCLEMLGNPSEAAVTRSHAYEAAPWGLEAPEPSQAAA